MTDSRQTDLSVYNGRYALSGRGMWVSLAWHGKHKEDPYRLPDGREYTEVIAAGEFDHIADQVWLELERPGSAQDILWSMGMAFTVVSRRLAEALTDICGEDEFQVFPMTLRRKRSPDVDGYAILIPRGEGPDRHVREFILGHKATSILDVDAGVLEELRARGITKFDVEDARARAASIEAEAAASAAITTEDSVSNDPDMWREEPAQAATTLTLTIDTSIVQFLFAVPTKAMASFENIAESDDGSLTLSVSDGAVVAELSRPIAHDAAGSVINAFWVSDGPRPLVNVDHLPGITAYPVTVTVEFSRS